MKEYKMTVVLDGKTFEATKRCFPHQKKEALDDFIWDCMDTFPYGYVPTVEKAIVQ